MKPPTKTERFWFQPAPPTPLALCRVLFFGWAFVWYFNFDFTAIALYPPDLFRPMQLLRWAQLDHIPTHGLLAIVQGVWKASLLLACIGFATRGSAVVACLLGAYLLGLTHSFYKINHSDGLLVMAMGVLAFSRCNDALSIDRLIRAKRHSGVAPRVEWSGEYTWPVQVIRIAFVCLFFGSGVSKLWVSGLDWMLTDNLYHIVTYCQLTREPFLSADFIPPPLFKVFAIGTVVVELLVPLALFYPVPRAVLIPSLLSMQIGIRLLMGDNFTQFMALYLFWVPWMLLLWKPSRARAEDHTGEASVLPGVTGKLQSAK